MNHLGREPVVDGEDDEVSARTQAICCLPFMLLRSLQAAPPLYSSCRDSRLSLQSGDTQMRCTGSSS